jgi:hypothetical protein
MIPSGSSWRWRSRKSTLWLGDGAAAPFKAFPFNTKAVHFLDKVGIAGRAKLADADSVINILVAGSRGCRWWLG